MMPKIAASGIATALACAWGCTSAPLPPEVSPEELDRSVAEVAATSVGNYVKQRARVLDIEYALTTGSAKRCAPLRPQAGVLLFHPGTFADDSIRAAANRNHALGEHLSVVHVVPGSSFDLAGIRPGDELLEIDRKTIRTESEFSDLLLETSERSSLQILVLRGEAQLELPVQLAHGCPVKFILSHDHDYRIVTGQGSKLLIYVPEGVTSFVADDDTLGMVLAHQFAHVLFDDPEKTWQEQELRADRYGLHLAATAGFDVSGAVKYWEAVAVEYPWLIGEALSASGPLWKGFGEHPHYGLGRRVAGIRATVREIAARQTANVSSGISPPPGN
ncbi:MAG: PDZ domain-containing protein [Myxococcales bacterium]|nr:PDZ domain-containing protein [Myxococcales bacterium]